MKIVGFGPIDRSLYLFSGEGTRRKEILYPQHHAEAGEAIGGGASQEARGSSFINDIRQKYGGDPEAIECLNKIESAVRVWLVNSSGQLNLSGINFTPLNKVSVGQNYERLNLERFLLSLSIGVKTQYPLCKADLSEANLSGVDGNYNKLTSNELKKYLIEKFQVTVNEQTRFE